MTFVHFILLGLGSSHIGIAPGLTLITVIGIRHSQIFLSRQCDIYIH